MVSDKKKALNNILFGILGQVVALVIGLILPRLRIISFGSEINGLLSSVSQIYVYLGLLEAGVGSATIQALYRPIALSNEGDINEILSAANAYYKKTGVVYLLCVLALAGIYPFVIASDINPGIVIAVILFNGLGNVLSFFFLGKYKMLLQAEGKQYVLTNLTTLVTFFSGVAKIVLISLGFNIVSLQIAYFVFCLLQVLYFAIYIKKNYKWINLHVKPNFSAISQKNSVLVHQISQLVFNNTDVLVLTVFSGLETVSIYAVYNMLYDMVSTLINNINSGISFKLGQLYNSEREKCIRLYTIYERYYTAMSMAFYSIAFVCMDSFIAIYTADADINYSLPYLSALFVAIKILVSGRAPSGFIATYAGHFKQTRNRAIIEMVINLVVSLTAVQFIGIYGVLLGTLAALLYRANDMVIYANTKLLGRNPMATYKFWIIDILLFILIIFVNSKITVTVSTYFDVIIKGIISAILICSAYFIVTFLFSRKETVSFMKSIKRT